MIEKTREVKVKNRDNGSVGYVIPDLNNLRRKFQSGEEKVITYEELEKLSWLPGGRVILEEYLLIQDEEVVNSLLGSVEPEYNYTEDIIKDLLVSGSAEQLEDFLGYAPEGAINLMKQIAVDIRLNDVIKRKLILDKTGFNVTTAIDINDEVAAEIEAQKSANTRKAAVFHSKEQEAAAKSTSDRQAPVYKVVEKK